MKTIAMLVGTVMLAGWLGQNLDNHGDEFETADQIAADLKAQERFEHAAQLACGENAGWIDLGNGVIQCTTKRGHRTGKAAMAEGGAK